jgi:maltose alpha-D-glucosyltransferase/alpha-amylase
LGQGISARLAELMERDPARIGLIYSIMLTLPGTPVIYYGDEFGKLNDEAYYEEMKAVVGKDDTRFLVRGKIDWKQVETALSDHGSFETSVYSRVSAMLHARNTYPVFGRGKMEWVTMVKNDGLPADEVMAYYRATGDMKVMVIQNLSKERIILNWDNPLRQSLLGNDPVVQNSRLTLEGSEYLWLLI